MPTGSFTLNNIGTFDRPIYEDGKNQFTGNTGQDIVLGGDLPVPDAPTPIPPAPAP